MEVKRGEEVKRRALNLIKKIKFRKGLEKRETKEKEEDPYISERGSERRTLQKVGLGRTPGWRSPRIRT